MHGHRCWWKPLPRIRGAEAVDTARGSGASYSQHEAKHRGVNEAEGVLRTGRFRPGPGPGS